ncbi:MAG: phosphate ABC transporter permease [Bacillota bacterium]|nr:MAG: phosphate ABC transporter permease [Bacillota bacterium]
MNKTRAKESASKGLFLITAIICIIAVITIFVFLIAESIPAFRQIGFFEFLFGDKWNPNKDDELIGAVSGKYGVFKMIVGSIAGTMGALLVGGVFGFFTAVFISRFCPKKIKGAFSAVINLLAGIPSVVYGFFGMAVLLPLLGKAFAPNGSGSGVLSVSLILGLMILPTVVSLSKTSLDAVPDSYYEGARALGATHEQAVFKTVVPAAKSGIVASLILGVGRAVGETMAVVMIAGNAVNYPSKLFLSFRTLTANIVLEMGYANGLHRGALVATGVVLLIFILIINLLFGLVTGRKKEKGGKKLSGGALGTLFYKMKAEKLGKIVCWVCSCAAAASLLIVVGFVVVKGIGHINWHFLFGEFNALETGADGRLIYTIASSIVTTLMVIFLSLIISVPLGIATAIYLNEYTKKGSKFVRLIRSCIDILSGIPSIVYALFGMITFVAWFGHRVSILAGSLTITLMLLPTIIRSTEESLKSVSDSLREGSFALGAGKVRTIFKVVLPSALSGIFSAIILAMSRVVSESAPFLYTTGSVVMPMPSGFMSGGTTLAVALYTFAGEGKYMNEAYATACVLIIVILLLNFAADLVGKKLSKKLQGDTNVVRKKKRQKERA